MFDLKGSTVDRNILTKDEFDYLNNIKEKQGNLNSGPGVKLENLNNSNVNNNIDLNQFEETSEKTVIEQKVTHNSQRRRTLKAGTIQLTPQQILSKLKKTRATELIEKHKGKVFKDKDLMELGFKFKMTKDKADEFLDCLKKDVEILRKFQLTDYSLLVSVHENPDSNIKSKSGDNDSRKSLKGYPNIRISPSYNNEILYSFSLIDFLVPYSFNKNIEKKFKLFAHYMKGDEDNNISAEEPNRYADRMIDFIEKNCCDS